MQTKPMLRERLKQEIDQLSENQLSKMADFIDTLKTQAEQLKNSMSFWQNSTPTERAKDFRTWVAQLPQTNTTLADDAFDRANIYE